MIQGGLENYFELRFHVCITLVQVMGKCFQKNIPVCKKKMPHCKIHKQDKLGYEEVHQ